jgi:hypothetical protein
MNAIVSAAPMTYLRGIKDESSRSVPREREETPSHMPKVYFYAKKGKPNAQVVNGGLLPFTYGDETFDMRGKYANHATALLNRIVGEGNAVMAERIIPSDAKDPARICLYLDVLETTLPVYARNTDGTYQYDTNNQLIDTGVTPISGFKAVWRLIKITDTLPSGIGANIGENTTKSGLLVDGTTTSTMYPIMEFQVSSQGEWGNDQGIKLWAPTTKGLSTIDTGIIETTGAYPYRISLIERKQGSTYKIVSSKNNEQTIDFVLKPGAIDKRTDKQVYIGDNVINSYQQVGVPGFVDVYGQFDTLYVYQDNIDLLLADFVSTEVAQLTALNKLDLKAELVDSTSGVNKEYMFNIASGAFTNAVPYYTMLITSEGNEGVRLTENTALFATGGTDGTMSDALFATAVGEAVTVYEDTDHPYTSDRAKYTESIIYDSGFPLDTKYKLMKFIAVRKDTAVVLNTHTVGQAPLSASAEKSLAEALSTAISMYPESTYYGTGVCRGMVVAQCGKLMGSPIKYPLPLSLEVARKASAYMGAGNGVWKQEKMFDRAPGNIVTDFAEVTNTFRPASLRHSSWRAGLTWAESYNRTSLFFPAFQTVFTDDTSILNSFTTMMVCVELQKVGERSHREFTGSRDLTNAQIASRVDEFILENTRDRFGAGYVIKSNTFFTEADLARGYSWTTEITLYGPNMKTVSTQTVITRRVEDLATA